MIGKIRELPRQVELVVGGLSDQELDRSTGEGEWTIRQVVHHLADSHLNAFIRLKLILTEENPPLKPYDQEAWAMLADTKGLPVQSSLTILKGLHERWVLLFEQLAEVDWSRAGQHGELGRMTAEDLLRIYAQHADDHLKQIARALD